MVLSGFHLFGSRMVKVAYSLKFIKDLEVILGALTWHKKIHAHYAKKG